MVPDCGSMQIRFVAFDECDLRKYDGYGGNTPTVGRNRRLRHHSNPDTKVFKALWCREKLDTLI